MFRGPGMVVSYWDRRGLMLGLRPFHALLIAGEARAPDAPTDEDVAVERFLRAAEPPGHDEWRATPALRQAYKRGGQVALERFHRTVTEELRLLLAPRLSQGTKGPTRLQKRFPIGPRGGQGSTTSSFRFSRLSARFDGLRWLFSGEVEPVERVPTWKAVVRLRELGDEATPLDTVPIEKLSVEEGHGTSELIDGEVHIHAASRVHTLAFSGQSIRLTATDDPPAELSFEVTGAAENGA